MILMFKQEPKKTGPNFKITKGVSTNEDYVLTFCKPLELEWSQA